MSNIFSLKLSEFIFIFIFSGLYEYFLLEEACQRHELYITQPLKFLLYAEYLFQILYKTCDKYHSALRKMRTQLGYHLLPWVVTYILFLLK